jgi:hypothetical protein
MTALEQVQLLPCPFCGGDEIGHAEKNGGVWIVCMNCGARGPDTVHGSLEDEQTWIDMHRAWSTRLTAAIAKIEGDTK